MVRAVRSLIPGLALCIVGVSAVPREAHADDRTPPASPAAPVTLRPDVTFPFQPYSFLYGALSTTLILHEDSLCPDPSAVCPFGGGGGIFVGGGWRYQRDREWLVGYDLSVRNARNLFSSATLQQVRLEHRWILIESRLHNFEAFAGGGGGVAAFGELLGVRTFGVTVGATVGATYNVGAFARVGVLTRLDATRFLIPFTAGDGVLRADGGLAAITMTFMLTASFLGH